MLSTLLVLSTLHATEEIKAATNFAKTFRPMYRLATMAKGKVPANLGTSATSTTDSKAFVAGDVSSTADLPSKHVITAEEAAGKTQLEVETNETANTVVTENIESDVSVTIVDSPSKHVITAEEAAGKTELEVETSVKTETPKATWSEYFGSFVPTSVSTAWNNDTYYFNTGTKAAGVLAGLYVTYKLSKSAYNWYTTPSVITAKDMLKKSTAEELQKAKTELKKFATELSKQDDAAFKALQAGLADKNATIADASTFFNLEVSKENPLNDVVAKQQATLKDAYSTVKNAIEQWNKDGRKGYSKASMVSYGRLYNKVVSVELNNAFAAIDAQVAELAKQPATK
jgi:hypothetical protein